MIAVSLKHDAEYVVLDFPECLIRMFEIVTVNLFEIKAVGAVVAILAGNSFGDEFDDGGMEDDVSIGAKDVCATSPANRHILGIEFKQGDGLSNRRINESLMDFIGNME